MATQKLAVAALALGFAGVAAAQTKWDLPAAYSPGNFHTENLVQFADDVDKATGGKLKSRCTPTLRSQSARDQARRAGRPAQAGEILLGQFENENPCSASTACPSSPQLRRSMKLYKPPGRRWKSARRTGHQLLYAVPWHRKASFQEPINASPT